MDDKYYLKCVKNTVMSAEKINRERLLQVRLTSRRARKDTSQIFPIDLPEIERLCPQGFAGQTRYTNQRNQSLDDFMAEMILLRNELNAIGNNFNQTVKRLHALQQIDEIKTWLLLNETARQIITRKIDEIKSKINQIDSQWLQ
jgi:hypothetical protein